MRSIIEDFAAIAVSAEEIKTGASEPETVCPACEGGGWTHYGIGFGDPHFRECEECHNPEGLSSP